MKNIYITLLTITLFSCTSNKTETNVEMGDNKEIDLNLIVCNCDSLSINDQKLLTYHDSIFTGTCFSNYPLVEQKYIDKQIVKGKIHGKVRYYDKFGKFLSEEIYNSGDFFENEETNNFCNCNDLNIKKSDSTSKAYLESNLFTGNCKSYFPNSEQLYLESNYKNGLLDGYTIYYKKDGATLFLQSYKEGKLLKEIFPKK